MQIEMSHPLVWRVLYNYIRTRVKLRDFIDTFIDITWICIQIREDVTICTWMSLECTENTITLIIIGKIKGNTCIYEFTLI